MKKVYLLFLILILSSSVVCASDLLAVRETVRKEVERGNEIILNKINTESDLCYTNVENTAQSYFHELREDFRAVFWFDRVVTFIGIYISFIFAFITSYWLIKRFERRKRGLEKEPEKNLYQDKNGEIKEGVVVGG